MAHYTSPRISDRYVITKIVKSGYSFIEVEINREFAVVIHSDWVYYKPKKKGRFRGKKWKTIWASVIENRDTSWEYWYDMEKMIEDKHERGCFIGHVKDYVEYVKCMKQRDRMVKYHARRK